MDIDRLENDDLQSIEDLEGLLHQVIVNAGLQTHLALSAVTSVLCQMIAALPEQGHAQAIKTAVTGINMGVEIFKEIPESNHFVTTTERRLDA